MRNAFCDNFERAAERERVVVHVELLVFQRHDIGAVGTRVSLSPEVGSREEPRSEPVAPRGP